MSIYNQNEPEPGEWQEEIDKFGGVKRFRMIGHIKEYEPTITINGLEIPQSQLEDYHRRQKEAEERRKTQHAEFIEHFKRLWDAEHSAERTKNESCNRTEKHH